MHQTNNDVKKSKKYRSDSTLDDLKVIKPDIERFKKLKKQKQKLITSDNFRKKKNYIGDSGYKSGDIKGIQNIKKGSNIDKKSSKNEKNNSQKRTQSSKLGRKTDNIKSSSPSQNPENKQNYIKRALTNIFIPKATNNPLKNYGNFKNSKGLNSKTLYDTTSSDKLTSKCMFRQYHKDEDSSHDLYLSKLSKNKTKSRLKSASGILNKENCSPSYQKTDIENKDDYQISLHKKKKLFRKSEKYLSQIDVNISKRKRIGRQKSKGKKSMLLLNSRRDSEIRFSKKSSTSRTPFGSKNKDSTSIKIRDDSSTLKDPYQYQGQNLINKFRKTQGNRNPKNSRSPRNGEYKTLRHSKKNISYEELFKECEEQRLEKSVSLNFFKIPIFIHFC